MMKQSSYSAGGYDWLEVWRQMHTAERNQAEHVKPPEQSDSADQWKDRAARFATLQRRHPQPDQFMQLLLPRLRSDDTVLDVGAGTGRYVPTLARHVARVIAVEPSDAMRFYIEQQIAEEGLQNVEVIGATWPMREPVQADVVLSAHVLYSVAEIGPFLQAMHAAAHRICVLLLTIRHFNMLIAPFWERVHGEPRLPLPAALEAYNALYQLGYEATMELIPARQFTYASVDEALDDLRQRLYIKPGSQHDTHLIKYMDELLVQHDDGSLSHRHQPHHWAVLWWEST